jgi:hypothetical protein
MTFNDEYVRILNKAVRAHFKVLSWDSTGEIEETN